MIMPGTKAEAAEVLAERLRRELRQASRSDAPLTLSIGIASLGEGPFDSPEQLFAAADSALYAAKSGGRDRVMHWAPDLSSP